MNFTNGNKTCLLLGDLETFNCDSYTTILGTILLIESALTIFFNSLFLVSLVKFSKFLSNSEVLFVLLAVSDILSGVMVMPLYGFLMYFCNLKNCALVNYVYVTGFCFTSISMITIVFITLDLYLAILHPFFYQRFITKRLVTLSSIFSWICMSLVHFSLIIVSDQAMNVYKDNSAYFVFCLVLILLVIHIKIMKEIKKISSSNNKTTTEEASIKMRERSCKMAFSMLVTFSICFLPLAVVLVSTTGAKTNSFVVERLLPTVNCIALSNSCFDPFVYFFRFEQIRNNVKSLFKIQTQ